MARVRRMRKNNLLAWFASHQAEFQPYKGKHIALVDIGAYEVGDSAREAYERAKAKHPGRAIALTYLPQGKLKALSFYEP